MKRSVSTEELRLTLQKVIKLAGEFYTNENQKLWGNHSWLLESYAKAAGHSSYEEHARWLSDVAKLIKEHHPLLWEKGASTILQLYLS